MPSTATEEVLEETPQTEEEEEEQEEDPLEESKATSQPVQRKPRRKKATVAAPIEPDLLSKKRQPSEDFFDYLQRITPEEWSNTQTSGLYIYKKSPKGNVRITDEPIHGPITLAEFREQFYPTHGDGNYRLQFTTGIKYLTSCGENVTFDSNGASLGTSPTASLSGTPVAPGMTGFTDAIKATSEMLNYGARAAVDVSKLQQVEHNKPPDIAGIITAVVGAITAVQPKNDGDSVLVKLLESQRKDAEDRIKAAKEEANAARERDQQFFAMMQKQSEGMNAILLKQAESKSDSLTQMTNLLTSFMTVREKIEDSFGGNQPKGWEGVIGNAIDKAGEILPAIMTRFGGAAGPAQQPQMIPGPQGPVGPQAPEQQEFPEMVHRIGKYLSRDVNLWDGSYLVRLIETEYPVTHAQLINQPKDVVLQAFQSLPIGKAILEHEAAAKLISDVLDVIKNPDLFDTIFPEEPEPEEEPEPGPVRRKRANGSIHREKVGEPV